MASFFGKKVDNDLEKLYLTPHLGTNLVSRFPKMKTNPLAKRPRVGLLSNAFCTSPVYFLTIAGWKHVAKGSDIVIFNRGHSKDWATDTFKNLASEWHDVQHMPGLELAKVIADQQIDVLYDLGGWMDPVGLQALSLNPASQQFKWVGGQSITTGLHCFDGWIGDEMQSPKQLQSRASKDTTVTPSRWLSRLCRAKLADQHRATYGHNLQRGHTRKS